MQQGNKDSFYTVVVTEVSIFSYVCKKTNWVSKAYQAVKG